MLLLNRSDIESVFSMEAAIAANKEAFALASSGEAVVPLRTSLRSDTVDGTFLFMPSYTKKLNKAALKTVNVFPGNAAAGLDVTRGVILLMDGETGAFLAMLDGTCVTALRTGAAAGAAYDLLARKDAACGALIGTGGQAECQLAAMLCRRALKSVRVFSRNREKREAFAKAMNKKFAAYGARIVSVSSADEAVQGADLVTAATTASEPVIKGELLKEGAVVCSIGSYTPEMIEMDTAVLKRAAAVYVDSRAAVLAEAGDFLQPMSRGEFSEDRITGELGELVLNRCAGRSGDSDIIVFKSVGTGIQDLVTAARIYEAAAAARAGTEWI